MRESRVIALAGVFQACTLVHALANEGSCDSTALESSLASVFRIDSDSAADTFGGLQGLKLGFESLSASLDSPQHQLAVSQLVLGVLRLERKLSGRAEMLRELGQGIASIQRQVDHLGVAHATVQTRQLAKRGNGRNQVGGSRWRMLLRRGEYAMLARGLLARCTLDRG